MPWKLKKGLWVQSENDPHIVSAHTFSRPPKPWLNVAEEFLLLLHNRIEGLFKNTLPCCLFFFLGWQQADTMSQASAGLCYPLLQVMTF